MSIKASLFRNIIQDEITKLRPLDGLFDKQKYLPR